MRDCRVIEGDCLAVLPTLESGSVDAVITDPPYPCIKRSYGYWTEEEWFALINPVVEQCRRVLKPTGSAVFILQPNSERVGRMRTWLWDFLAKWGREWGVVQDAWWWNTTAPPNVHCHSKRGMLRPSVKALVWMGMPDCYRDQKEILWSVGQSTIAQRSASRALKHKPSGYTSRDSRACQTAIDRGGSTPFNLVPIAANYANGAVSSHGASTPLPLCRWWSRYICPPGGLILDPFAGSGTVGLAALREGRRAILIEREPAYVEIIHKRLAEEEAKAPLFASGECRIDNRK